MIVVYCDICGTKDATHEFTPSYPWERSKNSRFYLDSPYTYSGTAATFQQDGEQIQPANPTHFDMCKNCVDKFGKLVESFFRKQ